jgi:hypothetical protein
MLIIDELHPPVSDSRDLLAFSSNPRNAAETKKIEETLTENRSDHSNEYVI